MATTNVAGFENASNIVTTVNVWDYDVTAASNFTFTATVANTNLATVSVTATNLGVGATNAQYTLTFAPVTNQNGSTLVQLIATEIISTNSSLSTTSSITLTLRPVNQAPSFTLATNWLLSTEESAVVTNAGFVSNISTGPTNQANQTWAFTTATATSGASPAHFTILPTISTNGTLVFQPVAHSYGSNLVTVIMTSSGSLTNGGVITATNTFVLDVQPIGHAPVIVATTNVPGYENASNIVTTVNVWDYDVNAASNFTFTATVANTNLATVSVTATNIGVGATNAQYTLTFAPGTNQNGSTLVQLIATEVISTNASLSTTNSITLTLRPVNQAPSFTLATNWLYASEESTVVTNAGFVSSISTGPTNQANQTWSFTTATATNGASPAHFAVLPTIGTNGTLVFQPATHSYGSNVVTVVMTSSGSTTNGGVITATNTFVLAVQPISHAPVIVATTTNVAGLENAPNVVTTVNVWDYDVTAASNFTFTATVANTNLANVSVTATNLGVGATNAQYTLTFAPGTNQNGSTLVQLIATEVISTNSSLSTTSSITLTLRPVNQAPSFTLATNWLYASEESTVVTNAGFVSSISTGPTNQANQTWSFTTTTATNGASPAHFAVLPTISTNGTLIFQPATHSYGSNVVSVVMTSSGSPTNGGVITATNTFVLAVQPISHAPVIVASTTNVAGFENASNIVTTVNVWDYDVTAASNFTFTATVANTNLANVSVTTTNLGVGATNAQYTLTFAPGTNQNGSTLVQLIATEIISTNSSLSTTSAITLTLRPVNQAPSFTLATNWLLSTEESAVVTNAGFVSNISTGPTNQANQTWAFTTATATSGASPAHFTILPTISTNGTLVFQPVAHSYGSNLVTVIMTSSGSLTNGGVITATNTFVLDVQPIGHAPVIVATTNVPGYENASNIVTTVNVWDYDVNAASNFTFTATVANTNLATVSVTATNLGVGATNAQYTLTFAPGTNQNGSTLVQLIATEVISTNASLSTTNSITLTLRPVNQAPSFTLATNWLYASEESTVVTNAGFVSNISTGPTNQANQTWSFTTTTATNGASPAHFAVLPTISTNGTLVFQPATHSYGSNVVSVVMTSSGSATNGGVITATNTFRPRCSAHQPCPGHCRHHHQCRRFGERLQRHHHRQCLGL